MNSDVIFKVDPSFFRVGPGSHVFRSISGHNDNSLVPGLGLAQETLSNGLIMASNQNIHAG